MHESMLTRADVFGESRSKKDEINVACCFKSDKLPLSREISFYEAVYNVCQTLPGQFVVLMKISPISTAHDALAEIAESRISIKAAFSFICGFVFPFLVTSATRSRELPTLSTIG